MIIQHDQAVSDLSIEAMCAALDVSASGYYAWCERTAIKKTLATVEGFF